MYFCGVLNADDPPRLRMAPVERIEQETRRVEREQRASQRQRESELERSLGEFRVGSVRYLNAVPLTRGLENEVIFTTPSELGRMLQRDELDAALVSVTEVLFTQRYDVLDGIAIASLGEVKSVLLAYRGPLEAMQEVFCDTASLTSVELLKLLLAKRGLRPQFKPLDTYEPSNLPDYALLIGDPALNLALGPHEHQLWDLGAAWYELTSLPFVYAVWALRRGVENSALRRQLREARDFGLDTLDHIIANREEYDLDFRKDYLSWHIHYHLGADEKRGLKKFAELLREQGERTVYEPNYVS